MTRKSCAGGMRNAILRNYLNYTLMTRNAILRNYLNYTLMTRKSCAGGMRNAILRNYLNYTLWALLARLACFFWAKIKIWRDKCRGIKTATQVCNELRKCEKVDKRFKVSISRFLRYEFSPWALFVAFIWNICFLCFHGMRPTRSAKKSTGKGKNSSTDRCLLIAISFWRLQLGSPT